MGSGKKKTLSVGVTGHRKLGDDLRAHAYVQAECVRILLDLRESARESKKETVAYSALAIGADHYFAMAALGLKLPLVGIMPFEEYPKDFEDGPERESFERLLGYCREVEWLPFKERSNEAYLRGGTWMVEQCDEIVAVWNGLPAAGKGGTADVVAYAEKLGKPVHRIDPMRALFEKTD